MGKITLADAFKRYEAVGLSRVEALRALSRGMLRYCTHCSSHDDGSVLHLRDEISSQGQWDQVVASIKKA